LCYPPDSTIVPAESVSGDDPGDVLARHDPHPHFDRRANISPRIRADPSRIPGTEPSEADRRGAGTRRDVLDRRIGA
jgi:hypothetical protein